MASPTNPTDSSTTLNPGVGGDVLDESSVVQSDGSTVAKRPRVDIGFQSDDPEGRLVAKGTPLPVDNPQLDRIANTLDEIRDLLTLVIFSKA